VTVKLTARQARILWSLVVGTLDATTDATVRAMCVAVKRKLE